VGTLRQRLVHAGYRHPAAAATYYGLRLVLAVGLPFAALSLPQVWTMPRMWLVILLCMLAAVGLVGPSMWLDLRRNKRQGEIRRTLPDALDLMVVCVEAGLGINASLMRVAQEFAVGRPVLAAEFELVTLEIRAGKSSTEALKSLSERTGVSEVSSLVAMLVQTERFGTNLADTLRVHADSMRVQRLQRAEELAAKAPLKMLFPTVLIFAATLIVTIGPGILQMITFFREKQ
jgi:tight adherence protein C